LQGGQTILATLRAAGDELAQPGRAMTAAEGPPWDA